jgi:hypothetical protein
MEEHVRLKKGEWGPLSKSCVAHDIRDAIVDYVLAVLGVRPSWGSPAGKTEFGTISDDPGSFNRCSSGPIRA